LALLVAPAAFAGPAPRSAQPRHAAPGARPRLTTAKLEASPHRASGGRSVGSPTDGHLIGGAHLAEAPHLRIVPAYADGDARWGLEPLVTMIDRAARAVRRQFPDAVASVGHLSRPGGGEIDRHASHESGRDADVGFYVKNQQNRSIFADHFVAFRGDGTAPSWPGAQFDDAKNWAFVAAIAADPQGRATHIFVASPLRTRLLQYAEKIGAPPAVRARAAELMAQPRGALPHDDHFHVRIACPAGMEKCVEQPLARRLQHGHGTLARSRAGHPATKPHGVARAPGHAAVADRTAPAQRAPAREAEPSRSESFVPSLAPMVPGLDSVVIPAPLAGTTPAVPPTPAADEPEPKGASAEPAAAPLIDDPDGILDNR
jgi:penicillin-insensitive murein endopeptidase